MNKLQTIQLYLMDANDIPLSDRDNLTVDFRKLTATVYPEPFQEQWMKSFIAPPEGTPSRTKYGIAARLKMIKNDRKDISGLVGSNAIVRTWEDPGEDLLEAFYDGMGKDVSWPTGFHENLI